MATTETSPEQSDESADPAVQLATEIAAGFERFAELSDEEVEGLEGKIGQLREMTERYGGWRVEGILTRGRMIHEAHTQKPILDASIDESGQITVSGQRQAERINANLGASETVASYELEGDDGDCLVSANGRYLAWESVNGRFQVSEVGGDGLTASGKAGDEQELMAVSSRGDVLIEKERRGKSIIEFLRPIEGKLKSIGSVEFDKGTNLHQAEFDADGDRFVFHFGKTVRLIGVNSDASERRFTTLYESNDVQTDIVCPVGDQVLMHRPKINFMISESNGGWKDLNIITPEDEVLDSVSSVDRLTVSTNRDFAVATTGSEVMLYSLDRLEEGSLVEVGRYSGGEKIAAANFSPDGWRLVIAETDGTVKAFDIGLD
jgi:hypothetical protein